MAAYPDPKEHPEEYAESNPKRISYDRLHCSEENPMEKRMKDGHKEVSNIRFNHKNDWHKGNIQHNTKTNIIRFNYLGKIKLA